MAEEDMEGRKTSWKMEKTPADDEERVNDIHAEYIVEYRTYS